MPRRRSRLLDPASHSIARDWKSIETISLIGFEFVPWSHSEAGLLSDCQHLRSLNVRPCKHPFPDSLLVDLPPTLRSLSIFHKQGDGLPLEGLRSIMASLKGFHLVEPAFEGNQGFRSALITQLRDVRSLTIGPWTVKDLSVELGVLEHLTEVVILTLDASETVSASEVLAFIHRASALRKLAVSSQIRSQWSEHQVDAIKAAALAHEVELGSTDYKWANAPGEWSAIASYDGQGW